tara:strand:+ start:177 stop:416 length:240 start_codon:yes stop_codon:yes gene_type:complete
MSDETTIVANEIVIELMDGTLDFETTRTTARTVGELRTADGRHMTGKISVGGVISSDSTPLTNQCEVVHQSKPKKGGNQ